MSDLFQNFRPHTAFSNESHYEYGEDYTDDPYGLQHSSEDSDSSSEEDYSDEPQDSNSDENYEDDFKKTENDEGTHQASGPSVHWMPKPKSDVHLLSGNPPSGPFLRLALQRLLLFKKSVSCLILGTGCLSQPDQPNTLDRQNKLALPLLPKGQDKDPESPETKNHHKSNFLGGAQNQADEQVLCALGDIIN